MSYRLTDRAGSTLTEADCVYDFNGLLPQPFEPPPDGDWHALDDRIVEELRRLGFSVREIVA